MREIEIPYAVLRRAIYRPPLDPAPKGNCIVFPVKVGWPELRLTEEQIIANAAARAFGEEPPYPDHSVFMVRLPLVVIE